MRRAARAAQEGGSDSADPPDLADIAEVLNVLQAAAATRMSRLTILQAIRKGELKAFMPGGRDPKKPGRGMGYRILKADLTAWYFGGQS